jgi:cytochrome c-type biogenesis protein CcmH/NrfG
MSIEPVFIEADPLDAEEAAQERALERRRQRVAEDARLSDINLGNPWSWVAAAIVVLLTILASSPAPF